MVVYIYIFTFEERQKSEKDGKREKNAKQLKYVKNRNKKTERELQDKKANGIKKQKIYSFSSLNS